MTHVPRHRGVRFRESLLHLLRVVFLLRKCGSSLNRLGVGNPVEGERDSGLKLNSISVVIPNSIPV